MGCGASAKGGGGHGGGKYKEGKGGKLTQAEEPKEDHHHKDGKTVTWHKKNCSDFDLRLAKSIAEAYPFDESHRKVVSKKEREYHPGDRRQNWGNTTVVKMYNKLNCAICKRFIVDKYEEAAFFFCLRCRNEEDKHLELCIDCYNDGHLATAKREFVEVIQNLSTGGMSGGGGHLAGLTGGHRGSVEVHFGHSSSNVSMSTLSTATAKSDVSMSAAMTGSVSPRASPRVGAAELYGDQRKTANPAAALGLGLPSRAESSGGLALPSGASGGGPRPSPRNPQASPRPSPRNNQPASPRPAAPGSPRPHASVPSGLWKGKVHEGGKSTGNRQVSYVLNFDAGGPVTGNGPENCAVHGTIKGSTKVKWKEMHEWGCLDVEADIVEGCQIRGKMKASDGGGGTITLHHSS